MLVVLRLSIGCHFLYEGVWKIRHADKFSAEPFLTQAKGPAAPLFYAMVYDIDGRQRLRIEPLISGDPIVDAWKKVRQDCETRYRAAIEKTFKAKLKDGRKLGLKFGSGDQHQIDRTVRRFVKPIEAALWDAEDQLESYLKENEQAILDFFASLNKSRPVDKEDTLPKEVQAWLSQIAQIEKQYHNAIRESAKGDKVATSAVSRSVKPVLGKPVLGKPDKGLPTDKIVLNKIVLKNRLRSPGGHDILRVDRGISAAQFTDAWSELKQKAVRKYDLGDDQQHEAERLYRRYRDSLRLFLAENLEDIAAYFGSLQRFEESKAAGGDDAAYQKKRLWDEQQKLRTEVGGWLSQIEGMDKDYRTALWNVLDEEQMAKGPLPAEWTRMDLMDLAVTYGLTAIGLCLVLGLCNRLACLGGGVFLVFVLLTQPPWPTIYPPAPSVVGHALVVDKNFVEMVAMFLLAATSVGRWGGLDFFLHRWIGRPIIKWLGREMD